MEYYCGEYFKHLEHKEYDQAYALLYPEFKQNYFPTLEEYETYIKNNYPKSWALEYEDITRQGNIYVLKLKILDILGTKDNEKSQRIVIKENNYNDFVISFQLIGNNQESTSTTEQNQNTDETIDTSNVMDNSSKDNT